MRRGLVHAQDSVIVEVTLFDAAGRWVPILLQKSVAISRDP
jgi:hypothetical protein